MKNRGTLACLSAAVLIATALSGCGGPATFVSDVPPTGARAEVTFSSGPSSVRAALRAAMLKNHLSVEQPRAANGALTATKPQIPYVGEGVLEPASGPLPYYVMRADVGRDKLTHVRLSVDVRHVGDTGAPYEWEYPTDLLKSVLEDARRALKERARYKLPPRYRPTGRWVPPQRR